MKMLFTLIMVITLPSFLSSKDDVTFKTANWSQFEYTTMADGVIYNVTDPSKEYKLILETVLSIKPNTDNIAPYQFVEIFSVFNGPNWKPQLNFCKSKDYTKILDYYFLTIVWESKEGGFFVLSFTSFLNSDGDVTAWYPLVSKYNIDGSINKTYTREESWRILKAMNNN